MFGWMVLVFVAGLVGANVVAVFLIAAGADLADPIPFTTVFIGQTIGSLAVVYLYSRRSSGSLVADVGLVLRGKDWWAIFAGMGLQVVAAIATLPIIEALFPNGAPEQGVAEVAGSTETTLEIILIFVSVGILAPILEEILYRGMLLSWLNRFMGRWPSIVLSAAIFASIHLIDWNARAAVPGLFIIGIALGWAAMRRGDLSLAIPLHAGVNLLAAFFLVWGPEILDWLELQLEELDSGGVNAMIHTVVHAVTGMF
jgi:membrane protease YdiL (CAAX protease family)